LRMLTALVSDLLIEGGAEMSGFGVARPDRYGSACIALKSMSFRVVCTAKAKKPDRYRFAPRNAKKGQ
jgi:hypothetical protein